MKPYVVQQTGQVAVSIVQAADFYPAAWNSDGDVTAAVFVDTTYINDKKYTRLEYHKLESNQYTMESRTPLHRQHQPKVAFPGIIMIVSASG